MRKIPSTVTEYKAVARRRWWLFLMPSIIFPLIVFFISRELPKSYRSSSTILIQTQIISKGLVDDPMQTDVKDRFESISNLILSQSRLMNIVDQLGLYKLPGVSSREEAMVKLRKDLTIEMEGERVEKQGSALFKITYAAPTPQLSQEVTREVANLSIASNLESREQQVEGNRTFIQSELDRAQSELKSKEERLSRFRAQHSEILPDQAAANLQLLNQNQALALSNSAAIERADQQRVYVQSMLDADGATHAEVPISIDSTNPQLTQKREELRIARQRYTDMHPDVVRLQHEVDTLQSKSKTASASGTQVVPTTNNQRQLLSQLRSAIVELHVREQRQAEIERKQHELSSRTQVSPIIVDEARQLQSDYDSTQKYYSSLVEKQHASNLAANLEKTRGQDLVQVLDPANLPRQPYSPNLKMINIAGVGLGLLLGVMLALVIELLDQTFHDQNDLATYLDVPMIAIIPTFSPVGQP